MQALDYKLVRGLWKLRGQVLAVSMIIASGVGVMIMSLSALGALEETASAYYERYRFADVFATLTRAPESLKQRIAQIPGVRTVDTRINSLASLNIDGFEEPVMGQLVSVPERGKPLLNQLVLRAGRFVSVGSPDEIILNEPFAQAHGLGPGDHLRAIIDGQQRRLDIVGIALSPEFVYALGPGSLMPDDLRYGIVWMGREALAASYDLDGAFNFVSLALASGTDPRNVIDKLDLLLDAYGGVGAVARENQISNWFLMNELAQLRTFSTVLPAIFLSVAAFLTNMVLARLITIERGEIGLLKSFGFSNLKIAWHYAKLVMAMSLVGIVLGFIIGAALGRYNTTIYADLFNFPILIFRPSPAVFLTAGLISLLAALTGSLGAVRRAVRLPPAEAMRPPSPLAYGNDWLSSTRPMAWLDQSTRIILRQLSRQKMRSLLTCVGIAFSVAVMVMALQWIDSIDHMVEVYFNESQHQDVVVGLNRPREFSALHDAIHLPGVLAAEPLRWAGADFSKGAKTHRGAIQAVMPDAELQFIHDVNGRNLTVAEDGLVLGTELAEKLGIGIDDLVHVKIREGRRPELDLPVTDLVETYIDLPAYMHLTSLNKHLRQGPRTEYISLLVDPHFEREFYRQLKQTPSITAVMVRDAAIMNFKNTMAETIEIFINFFGAFALALGFGVVYNSARVTLSERGRELASLRVLGFSRAAISYILLGELGLLVLIALPLGCLLGWSIAWLIVKTTFENEMFRLPLIIDPSSYATAIIITLIATAASAFLVRKRLDRLDLIAVLKTRE